jgi:hypothetical protein
MAYNDPLETTMRQSENRKTAKCQHLVELEAENAALREALQKDLDALLYAQVQVNMAKIRHAIDDTRKALEGGKLNG